MVKKARMVWMVVGLSLCFAGSPSFAFTLKIATLAPEGTAWMAEIRAGADEIAKATEGRVKFKFYPGGVMGNDRTVMRKIRVGQLHGGAFTGGSLADVSADAQVYGMPFLFRSLDEVDYVRERVDGEMAAAIERGGMVALGISGGGFAYLLSDAPVADLDGVRRKKVWIPEGDVVSQTAFQVAGISPVPLPIADVYTGLQTGLVDTVAATPEGAIAFQWHTKVKYLVDVPLMYLVGVLTVSQKAFARLSTDDQATVREVMGRVFARLDGLNRASNANARKALEHQGIRFVTPSSDAEKARWEEAARKALDELAGNEAVPSELLGRVRTLLAEYRKIHGRGT